MKYFKYNEGVYQTFSIYVTTINGRILRCPELYYLRCEWAKGLGPQIVKQFDANECIVAKKVFLFYYVGDVFGTNQVSSVKEFNDYMNASCSLKCLGDISIFGCQLNMYNCAIRLYK